MNSINGDWFSISNDNDDFEKRFRFLDENYEKKIAELENKIKDLENNTKQLENKVIELDGTCNKIRNENLKLINRVLEAEISIERTKNILLRKNISFPFTPLTTKFL